MGPSGTNGSAGLLTAGGGVASVSKEKSVLLYEGQMLNGLSVRVSIGIDDKNRGFFKLAMGNEVTREAPYRAINIFKNGEGKLTADIKSSTGDGHQTWDAAPSGSVKRGLLLTDTELLLKCIHDCAPRIQRALERSDQTWDLADIEKIKEIFAALEVDVFISSVEKINAQGGELLFVSYVVGSLPSPFTSESLTRDISMRAGIDNRDRPYVTLISGCKGNDQTEYKIFDDPDLGITRVEIERADGSFSQAIWTLDPSDVEGSLPRADAVLIGVCIQQFKGALAFSIESQVTATATEKETFQAFLNNSFNLGIEAIGRSVSC